MTLDAVWCGVCLRGENQWLSLSFAIAKIGQPSGRSHAVGTDHTEGVRDGAGWWRREPSGHETVPGEGGAYWSLQYVFLWAGSGTTDSGAIQTPKILKEDKRFYRIYPFTDFSIRGQRVRSLFTPRDAPAVSRTG